jgi:hypothetical protein
MRLFIVATVAASVFATNLLAAEAGLPAGKPAGVHKAQDADTDTLWWVVGGAVVVGAIAAVASGGNSAPVTTPPTTS